MSNRRRHYIVSNGKLVELVTKQCKACRHWFPVNDTNFEQKKDREGRSKGRRSVCRKCGILSSALLRAGLRDFEPIALHATNHKWEGYMAEFRSAVSGYKLTGDRIYLEIAKTWLNLAQNTRKVQEISNAYGNSKKEG